MSCGCVSPEVLGHQDGCASLEAVVERSVATIGDPMAHRSQGPCPCCGRQVGGDVGDGGCYAPGDLPANWMDVEPWASQRCTWRTDVRDPKTQCKHWGGPDLECEDCWLASK